MVKYHPDTRYLTEYAAGSLSRSLSLCVAVHLHYCPVCRSRVRDLTGLGAALFEALEPQPVADDAFARLMTRIGEDEAPALNGLAAPRGAQAPATPILPEAIRKLARGDLDSLDWRSVGKSFRYFNLQAGDDTRQTSLLHIKAGGTVPQHRHGGEEVTVVLKGSFSDLEDHYHLGDFIVRTPGEKHRPVASQHEDCLCLATLEAPNTMTNWVFRVLQPLFRTRTA